MAPKTTTTERRTRDPISPRLATANDLPEIVRIYNTSIADRMATADLVPVSVADRSPWFHAHEPTRRPIWVVDGAFPKTLSAWLSFSDFYGRAAYDATCELSIYVDPSSQRQGFARGLLHAAVEAAPGLGITTLLGFIFDHNEPSLALFRSFGFEPWGRLPRIAQLDDHERGVVIVGRRLAP